MRRTINTLALVGALAFANQAGAQDFYIGPQIGVPGIGVSAEVDVDYVSLSAEVTWVPVNSVTYEQNGTEYLMDASTVSGLFLVNAAPAGGRFTIGVGVLVGGISGEGEAVRLAGGVDVGDNTYPATSIGNMEVELDFGGVAPAAMLGLRKAGFNFGVGLALTGKPTYTMRATGAIANNPQFQADLELDIADVQDELDRVPFMPLLRFGWQIGFGG